MSCASVAQAVSRVSVGAALQAARIEAQEHQAWITAINRAALNLEACKWQFNGEVLIIHSATKIGHTYMVDAHGCECPAALAGRPCWHRAARRLLIKAAELTELAQEMRIAEGLDLGEALSKAAAELAPLQTYARQWDAARIGV